jgi:L-ascorbate metabolism protein UlaG (beta-lactamase superfamily)
MNKLLFAAALLAVPSAGRAAGKTTITFHGHSAFEIVTPKGKVLFVDPWLKNPVNPAAANGADPLAKVKKADYLLVTHGHFDHVGDAVALAKTTKARLVANYDLGNNMVRVLGFPKDQVGFDTMGNSGGELKLADGEIVVQFTPAVHSSSLDGGEDKPLAYGGNPNGFLLKIKDGPIIYHSGDTAFFKDMEQLAAADVDLALLNIGGHFGMEPQAAADAARVINAKFVVPHHYKGFPILTQDVKEFFDELEADKIEHLELQPGKSLVFDGRSPVK